MGSGLGRGAGYQKGLTLLELVVTIVIVTLGAGVLYSYMVAVSRSPEPVLRARLVALAEGMVEEIVAKRWDERTRIGGGALCTTEGNPACPGPMASTNLGPDPGESLADRTSLDDVDDYNGLVESDTFVDQEGRTTVIKGASLQVQVCYIRSSSTTITATQPACSNQSTNTKRIVVTVKGPGGEQVELVTVRCNY